MARFGAFNVVRELPSGDGAIVYLVREESNPREFIVKLFPAGAEAGSFSSFGDSHTTYANKAEFFAAAQRQQQSAPDESGPVAPIFQTAEDPDGAWYRSLYYKDNLKRFIGLHLKPEIFHSLVLSIVRGALALKQRTGAGHGNLKLSNVFIVREGRASRAIISDPLPPRGRADAEYELEDLRAIGEIIYQLIRGKESRAREQWPLPASPEWTAWFGKQAEKWRDLCNRLIDPHLVPGGYSLEQLEGELLPLKPKGHNSILAMAAILVLTGAIIIGGIYWAKNRGPEDQVASLQINITPSDVEIFRENQELPPDAPRPYKESFATETNVTFELNPRKANPTYQPYRLTVHLKRGQQLITNVVLQRNKQPILLISDLPGVQCFQGGMLIGTASVTGTLSAPLEVGIPYPIVAKPTNLFLQPRSQQVLVDVGSTQRVTFNFPRGGIVLTSAPAAVASVRYKTWTWQIGPNPTTNEFEIGTHEFFISAPNFNTQAVSVAAVPNLTVREGAILKQGEGKLRLTVRPADAEVVSQGRTYPATNGVVELTLPAAEEQSITLRHSALTNISFKFPITRGGILERTLELPHAILRLDGTIDGKPAQAEIRGANGLKVTNTPAILLVNPGPVKYELYKQIGPDEYNGKFEQVVRAKDVLSNSVPLTAGSAEVALRSNVDGVSIYSGDKLVTNLPSKTSYVSLGVLSKRLHLFRASHPDLGETNFSVDVPQAGRKEQEITFDYGSVAVHVPREVDISRADFEAGGERKSLPLGSRTTNRETVSIHFPMLKPGRLQVTLSSLVYEDKLVLVTNKGGGLTYETNVSLTPASGTVSVLAEPPQGVKVSIDRGPERDLPLLAQSIPAGDHTFVARYRGKSSTNTATIEKSSTKTMRFAFEGPRTMERDGFKLVWVGDMPGLTNGCWVGQAEVTFHQLTNALGKFHREQTYRERNYVNNWPSNAPADSVTEAQVDQFFSALGAGYRLMTRDEYVHISQDARTNQKVSVCSDWFDQPGQTNRTRLPQAVDVAREDDQGFIDLNGNLQEWVALPGSTNKVLVGSAYCSIFRMEVSPSVTCKEGTKYVGPGFRVLRLETPPANLAAADPASSVVQTGKLSTLTPPPK